MPSPPTPFSVRAGAGGAPRAHTLLRQRYATDNRPQTSQPSLENQFGSRQSPPNDGCLPDMGLAGSRHAGVLMQGICMPPNKPCRHVFFVSLVPTSLACVGRPRMYGVFSHVLGGWQTCGSSLLIRATAGQGLSRGRGLGPELEEAALAQLSPPTPPVRALVKNTAGRGVSWLP